MTSPLEQKKRKIAGEVIVTANRLHDGAVIYRAADGGWTVDLAAAAVVPAAAAPALLAQAEAEGAVGAYVAPVVRDGGNRVRPGNLRERIRHRGPTVAPPGMA